MKKVFVYGWYGNKNIGDEAFKLSFLQLWPTFNFTFSGTIPADINEAYDAFWIGGGSFLEQHIPKLDSVKLPIAFIGVGSALSPSASIRSALDAAKVIVFRDKTAAGIWPHSFSLADLVFARSDIKPLPIPKKKQIAVFLNDFITPHGKVTEWESLAYQWFLQEFSKILDRFSATHKIKLFPMCTNPRVDDRRVAAAILGRSEHPHRYDWILEEQTEMQLRTVIRESEFVITQRFHGLIYSILEETPCLTLSSHDKFKSLCKELDLAHVDFYGLTDASFGQALSCLDGFMSKKVCEYKAESKVKWNEMAAMIEGIF